MAIKDILTDVELIGRGLSHRENIQRINDNFQEVSGGGSGPSSVSWNDVEDKPTTFPPITGTAADQAAPGDHAHTDATASAPGFMTAAMVTKLDGVATGANNYTLPDATESVSGGVKKGVAVADASDETDAVVKLNELLASLRAAGIIS